MAHLKMVASAQPFVSGAISKTVNMPKETTVSEVQSCFLYAWQQGLKSISIYRDGSKLIQPLNDKFVSPDCCSL
jgi:ribonucleoside-diphosphate reductase alpha chain